jgi:hypothetical protein
MQETVFPTVALHPDDRVHVLCSSLRFVSSSD